MTASLRISVSSMRRIIRVGVRWTKGLATVALVVTAVYAMGTPSAPHVHLTAIAPASYISGNASYQVSETYGGTNPIDTCPGCDSWGDQEVGTASPPSVQPSQIVNPLTGDESENYTLFSQPDPGFNFEFNLTYDSLWGQLETYFDSILGTTGNETLWLRLALKPEHQRGRLGRNKHVDRHTVCGLRTLWSRGVLLSNIDRVLRWTSLQDGAG